MRYESGQKSCGMQQKGQEKCFVLFYEPSDKKPAGQKKKKTLLSLTWMFGVELLVINAWSKLGY